MSVCWNSLAFPPIEMSAGLTQNTLGFYQKFPATAFKVRSPFKNDVLHIYPLSWSHSRRTPRGLKICMSIVNERPTHGRDVVKPSDILAYDLVQGANVRWSYIMDKSVPDPPTAVLVHGILGSRKNWGTFARRLAQEFPAWQFLLVDLRCHGDSAAIKKRGPHTVASAATDVLKLLGQLRITPRVVVGHSFGGKVALSMVDQAAKPLGRPVRVWVLDATPGKVRAGGDGEDHPAELISFLRTLPKEVAAKKDLVNGLVREGFSKDVAEWVVTNLRRSSPSDSAPSSLSWIFDLNGIAEMYQSYEETNLWYAPLKKDHVFSISISSGTFINNKNNHKPFFQFNKVGYMEQKVLQFHLSKAICALRVLLTKSCHIVSTKVHLGVILPRLPPSICPITFPYWCIQGPTIHMTKLPLKFSHFVF